LCSKVWFSSCVVGIDWVYSLLFTKKSLSLLSIRGHKEEETYREDPIPMSSGPWEQLFQDPHSWIVNRNKALRLSLVLHDMPAKYPKDLPRFNGDDAFVNVYAIIIVLCISIDKSIIRTRSLRNTHSQETQHLSWETL
jgi:hypothetical protein